LQEASSIGDVSPSSRCRRHRKKPQPRNRPPGTPNRPHRHSCTNTSAPHSPRFRAANRQPSWDRKRRLIESGAESAANRTGIRSRIGGQIGVASDSD
jgi:hypothetical protein